MKHNGFVRCISVNLSSLGHSGSLASKHLELVRLCSLTNMFSFKDLSYFLPAVFLHWKTQFSKIVPQPQAEQSQSQATESFIA